MQNDQPEGLSERELEILTWMAKGDSNQQIAERLFLSKKTVDFHVGNILQKMGVENRVQAVVDALRRGWVEL